MTDSKTSPVVGVLAEAAHNIDIAGYGDERVHAILKAAPAAVPGFDQASISVAYRNGPVETRAATSDLVLALDLVQYQVQEGPCLEAFTRPTVVLVPTVRHEQRWPAYIPRAVEEGVTAQMAVPLRDGRHMRGALNLYSTTAEGIDPGAPDIASMFATHVALALGWARTEEQLTTALSTRTVIGQAMGVLMERHQISDEKAFAFLTRVSSSSNIKLRDVAQELVTQSNASDRKDSR